MASQGYPESYDKGLPIRGLENANAREDIVVFHAGTTRRDGDVYTDGGRVLCITAIGANIRAAVNSAYAAIDEIFFAMAYYRRDIAQRAIHRGH